MRNILSYRYIIWVIGLICLALFAIFGPLTWLINDFFRFNEVENKARLYLDHVSDIQYTTLVLLHMIDAFTSLLNGFCKIDGGVADAVGSLACVIEPYELSLANLIKLTWISTFVTEITNRFINVTIFASVKLLIPIACFFAILDILRYRSLSFISKLVFTFSALLKFGLPLLILGWSSIWSSQYGMQQDEMTQKIEQNAQKLQGLQQRISGETYIINGNKHTQKEFNQMIRDYRESLFDQREQNIEFYDEMSRLQAFYGRKNTEVSYDDIWESYQGQLKSINNQENMDILFNDIKQLQQLINDHIPLTEKMIMAMNEDKKTFAFTTFKLDKDFITQLQDNNQTWLLLEQMQKRIKQAISETNDNLKDTQLKDIQIQGYYEENNKTQNIFSVAKKAIAEGYDYLVQSLGLLAKQAISTLAQAILFPLLLAFIYYSLYKIAMNRSFYAQPNFSGYKKDMNKLLKLSWKDYVKKKGSADDTLDR